MAQHNVVPLLINFLISHVETPFLDATLRPLPALTWVAIRFPAYLQCRNTNSPDIQTVVDGDLEESSVECDPGHSFVSLIWTSDVLPWS